MAGTPIVLAKGQNAPLPAGALVVTVDLSAPADLSALLVTSAGKVRTDADFVFFNQPDGPGVRCRQPATGQPGRIEIDPAQLPASIEQVRVVSNLADPASTFGSFPPPVARVTDASGLEVIRYQATGLSSESILIAIEIYRRGDTWKVRAVGQGYAGGLADLIVDHGVSVDDAQPPAAPDNPLPYPPPTAAPPYPPPTAAPPYPPPTAAPPYPPPQYPPPGAAPPQAAPPPAAPRQPPAAAQPYAPPPPPPQYAPTNPVGEVSLVKGRSVSLQKGQRVSLRKDDGAGLTLVRMGLGWDPVKKRRMFGSREIEIDLDASAVLYAGHESADIVFFNNLHSKDGSVQHMGDNRTGAGEGDDETMLIDLVRVPAHISTIMFIVTSYEGQTFEQVGNAFCRLVDHTNGGELARYTLAGGIPFTGMVMAKVFREGGSWKLLAIGEGIQARTPLDALPQLTRYLS